MWSESFRVVSTNGRKWWRRQGKRAFVDCGEIHVEIREDVFKRPFPVVTRVDGLPEVQRFVARPRMEQNSAAECLPSRLACLRVSNRTILQLAAVSVDGRSELVAMLGYEEEGGRQEYEISDIEVPQLETPQIKSMLRHVTRMTGDNDECWSCVVCCEGLNDINALQLPCGHVFHEGCIYKWLMRRTSCPSCRNEISSHGNTSKHCLPLLHGSEGSLSSNDGSSDQRSQRSLRNPALTRHRRRMEISEDPEMYDVAVEQMEGYYRLRFRSVQTDTGRRAVSPIRKFVNMLINRRAVLEAHMYETY
eukprot:Plantae.Rhodophyta-Purpureofilum_apyrenoidigerum.ctg40587.p1 GENE.Plantae.Rhodophyta-Purpureofilum_apyrenoidigerum.ctg40587~~Plantae.Rhodophyta-Purpureofilum_apyrenoidigerum.ctg40587.p1  ORF type:complete len:305 (+),score=29.42 Plantae.Rhodophyta-Purpureofilum_apyrenoidigerum.ctg40587:172-1086(+)